MEGVVTRESLIDSLRLRGFKDSDYHIREVDEDFSHLPEWDRPPPLIAEGIRCAKGIHYDRGLTRKAMPRLPSVGDIADLRDSRSGACVVLGNGPSVASFDLHAVAVPIMGCNRTFRGFPGYDGPDTHWLCVIDVAWLKRPEIRKHPGLLNISSDGERIGIRVAKSYRMDPWSFDVARDGVVPVDTGYCAVQLAVYFGFTDIYLIGFEGMGHGHFDGTKSGSGMQNQNKYFLRAAEALKGVARIHTVGFDNPAFDRAEFSDLTEGNVTKVFLRNHGLPKVLKFNGHKLRLESGEHDIEQLWTGHTWMSRIENGRPIRQAVAQHFATHCPSEVKVEWR